MKKLFAEPEIEILTFLCDGGAVDSVTTGGDGIGGGDNGDGELPLP